MILFVDASALLSILLVEPDRDRMLTVLTAADARLWSPMSCWETVASLRLSRRMTAAAARRETEDTAQDLGLRLVPVAEQELEQALDAYERYGKGSAHPARLNMGDCFAYACARTNGARLLYKGDDFVHTDMG